MKLIPISKNMVDVFLNTNTSPTGFEPSCWIRLQKRGTQWVQIAGIKLASWKFKELTMCLTPETILKHINQFAFLRNK